MDRVNERIKTEVEEIPIVDTHEHIMPEAERNDYAVAFGGDPVTVEMAYGHSRMARQVVARVLSEKVSEGYMTEDEAAALARKILRDNPGGTIWNRLRPSFAGRALLLLQLSIIVVLGLNSYTED